MTFLRPENIENVTVESVVAIYYVSLFTELISGFGNRFVESQNDFLLALGDLNKYSIILVNIVVVPSKRFILLTP